MSERLVYSCTAFVGTFMSLTGFQMLTGMLEDRGHGVAIFGTGMFLVGMVWENLWNRITRREDDK